MKEVEEANDALDIQAIEVDMEKYILVEATVSAEASDAAETTTIGMIFDPISDNVFNSYNPQTKTKTSFPYKSP